MKFSKLILAMVAIAAGASAAAQGLTGSGSNVMSGSGACVNTSFSTATGNCAPAAAPAAAASAATAAAAPRMAASQAMPASAAPGAGSIMGNGGYVQDSRGVVVRSGTGQCSRTSFWTPAMALAACEGGMGAGSASAGAMASAGGISTTNAKPLAAVPVRANAGNFEMAAAPAPMYVAPAPMAVAPMPTPTVVTPAAPVAPAAAIPAPAAPAVVPRPAAPSVAPAPVATPAAPVVAPVATAPAAPALPAVTVEKVTFAADAFFDTNKAVLKPEAKAKLDDLASKIKAITLEVIIAVGHTDSDASDAYNQKLSVKRAESVKAYLVSKGIEANRVYTEGKGEKQPVADNKTKEGKAKNRRTEIEVVGTRPIKR